MAAVGEQPTRSSCSRARIRCVAEGQTESTLETGSSPERDHWQGRYSSWLKLKLGSGHVVKRPFQQVRDLEIGGGDLTPRWIPNPDAAEFVPRRGPRPSAKDAALSWIKDVLADEGKDT